MNDGRRTAWLSWPLLMLLSVATLAGCPMPSTWTTPRTIPAGTMSHTIGVEAVGVAGRDAVPGEEDSTFDGSGFVVAPFIFPAYLFRVGLADQLDMGIKASTAGALVVDLKVQLVKTPIFDLALDPSLQLSFINFASLPVLMAINGGEAFSFYFGPRATVLFLFSDDDTFTNGFAVGATVGFRISPTPRFSIYPELNWLRPLDADANGDLVTFGLGFSFGNGQPYYGPGSIAYTE